MSYSFSKRSKDKLNTCDERLQKIMNELITVFNFTVLEGFRSQELQNLYYEQGKSKLKFPQSKHNKLPSLAVDIIPYKQTRPHLDWNDREQFVYMAGIVKGIATNQGVTIRWGGDWDKDNNFKDQTFNDLPHFEIVEPK